MVGVGLLTVGAGWVVGRIFGKLGHTMSSPRPLNSVALARTASGGIHLTMRGANRLQAVQMGWNTDEVLAAEADNFMAKFDDLRR